MKPSNLARRITLGMWFLSALSCLFAVALSTFLILRNSEAITRERIDDAESTLVSLGFLELLSQNTGGELNDLISETLDAADLSEVVQVYRPPGILLHSNMEYDEFADSHQDLRKYVDKGLFVRQGTDRKYYSKIRSYRASNGKVFWLEIAAPRPIVEKVLRDNIVPFSLIFLVLILFSLIAARIIVSKTLRPLTDIATTLDTLDSDQIKRWQQIPIQDFPQDFQSIIIKVNELMMRVQSSFLKFHQIGNFIAHEIRTPLTIIRGEIETTLMKESETGSDQPHMQVLRSALDEVTRMDEIVNTVLRLASRERHLKPYRPENIDLVKYLKDSIPSLEKLIQRKVKFEVTDELISRIVFIDPELFSLLISNLVRNIAKHTSPQTEAKIVVSSASERGVLLEVIDNGPGLPDRILQEANDKKAISEHLGLGLTLCREIAEIGRLELFFVNLQPHGLAVRIFCPKTHSFSATTTPQVEVEARLTKA